MSFAWASATLTARFLAAWKETDVAFGGDEFPEPSPPRPFIVVEVEGGQAGTLGMGGGDGKVYTRQPLSITLDVFSPTAEGRARSVELADAAGLILARLALGAGQSGPWLLTRVPSTSGPWPARGTAGYLNARCEIEGHIDFWSKRAAETTSSS